MPPIPSTLDEETKTLIAALERRQKDLLDFQIPRLRSCKGPLATQQQYAAELREDIEAFSRQVEGLDVAVDDQRGERNRRELRQIVEEFKQALASLRKDSRAAVLASKRVIDANALSNREELLRSSAIRQKQDLGEQVAEDALMHASNNVTESLQRTLTLMQGELEKSVLSTQLLDASTASLRSASSTHDTLDSLMQTSKHLITALEKSDWLDRLLIIAALVFFVLVVLFIMQQRVVSKGLRVAFWWTRFIPVLSGKSGKGANMLDVMEKGSASVAESVLTSVSAVVTAVATSAASVAVSSSVSTALPASQSLVDHGEMSEVTAGILSTIIEPSSASTQVTSLPSDAKPTWIAEPGPESSPSSISMSEESEASDTVPSVSPSLSVHDEL